MFGHLWRNMSDSDTTEASTSSFSVTEAKHSLTREEKKKKTEFILLTLILAGVSVSLFLAHCSLMIHQPVQKPLYQSFSPHETISVPVNPSHISALFYLFHRLKDKASIVCSFSCLSLLLALLWSVGVAQMWNLEHCTALLALYLIHLIQVFLNVI